MRMRMRVRVRMRMRVRTRTRYVVWYQVVWCVESCACGGPAYRGGGG